MDNVLLQIEESDREAFAGLVDKVRALGYNISYKFELAIQFDPKDNIGRALRLVEITADKGMAFLALGTYMGATKMNNTPENATGQ